MSMSLRIAIVVFAVPALWGFAPAPRTERLQAPKVAAAGVAPTLRVRAFGDPVTLDWNRATTWVEGFVIRNLMEGLVEVDSKLQPVPALAESWTASKDHKVYTFKLRHGVKWSDGVALRASDFVASWRRLLLPETRSRYASFLFDLENAEKFNKGELKEFSRVGVRALDDHTLEVRLRASVPYWYWIPSYIATFPIREDLIRKDPEDWTAPGRLVSVGPFRLTKKDTGKRVVLERNPHYYGKTGNLGQVDIALEHDDTRALKMYEAGKIDFLPKISSLERERLQGRPDLRSWDDLRVIHLRVNTSDNPTVRTGLRRAIAMSIDRAKLAKIFAGGYAPATSFVPAGMLGHSTRAGLGFNPGRAKAELKKTGLNPAILPPLDILTVAFSDQIILAQFIQSELKQNLGLNTRIHIFEPKRYYSPSLRHSDFSMQVNFWGADFPDADSFYSIFLSNSGLNRYKWTNEQYDKLVTRARSLSGKKSRAQAYLQAQKVLLEEEVATIPMYYSRVFGLVRDNIEGFNPGPLNWWSFKDLSVKEQPKR